ncbi:lysine N(6)-hydroxylase/L-ornithine N(5)-oxygenase family protein [Pontibacillus sp. ALD_SL1]|uniref:lysine N(6)-hydroxylase/L-ornithine N(5)-oxygenase family protein n=1 Tax=Pontibacillus sp. ALD_SL1 TaxID=2777185 RepID=UPI001A96A436|nr:lysine N(6)-hydroxylase/L-ornithine N(5)-oxygenase family protein [Pontibacillus sp. ALD_SL1]QST01759.1 lysine N(6)-hydroxylase/L-ornithine N(5)-oxygenase family protein [Pontibacillus sp. ALD_SL1]
MSSDKIYDLIGVGIGPFNLSMAALLDDHSEVDALFFEQRSSFDWHPGMLIEGTKMQVPFIADLVTMANPKSHYSFLNYINEHGRMYPFYFLQRLDIPRREYNDYCQWVAGQLDVCQFGKKVESVRYIEDNETYFEVFVVHTDTGETNVFKSRHLLLGTGSVPVMPESFEQLPKEDVFHTAQFKDHIDRCRKAKAITVIGSGQSAAETFRELLKEQREHNFRLDWITRSTGFSSMEESKLSLEHFSPDYVNYFYQLPQSKKDEVFATQGLYYKGISTHTATDIYDLLYEYSVGGEKPNVGLQVLTEVNGITKKPGNEGYEIACTHHQEGSSFTHETEVVITATGYKPHVPDFVKSLGELIEWDEQGRYMVEADYRIKKAKMADNEIYVHSGISHSHGVGSTNLGLAVHRNKVIINHLLKRVAYPIPDQNVFQSFQPES